MVALVLLIGIIGLFPGSCIGLNTSTINTDYSSLVNAVHRLNQTVDSLIRENAALKHDIQSLKAERNGTRNGLYAIAFMASVIGNQQLNAKQMIDFDKVITNVGNAYDKRLGHFTAPVKGIYMFSTTLMSTYGEEINAEIVKNGERIMGVESERPDNDTATGVVLLVLEVNDLVWIRSTRHGEIYAHEYTTFSGYLVTEL